MIDLSVTVKGKAYDKWTLYLAAGEKHYSTITYDRKAEVLTFDRTYSGVHWNIVHNRSMAVKAEEELSLRILMDRYTVEILLRAERRSFQPSSIRRTRRKASSLKATARPSWM